MPILQFSVPLKFKVCRFCPMLIIMDHIHDIERPIQNKHGKLFNLRHLRQTWVERTFRHKFIH